ncbi:hypothetical protein Esti_000261 [Eimeria stiedai]
MQPPSLFRPSLSFSFPFVALFPFEALLQVYVTMGDAEVSDGERDAAQDISSPQVAEKCRVAAEIANAALKLVLSRAVPGADVLALCLLGDAFISNESKKVYQKKDKSKRKVDKGIAVPTSVAVNEVFANFSPAEAAASRKLCLGDLVKVDLGVHIDGYVAAAAYTVVCCSSNAAAFEPAAGTPAAAAAAEAAAAADAALSAYPPLSEQQQQQGGEAASKTLDVIEGPAAAVLKAAWVAVEAALRKLEVGAKASAVTKSIEQVAAEFGGVLSYQLKQHVIEGSKCFPLVLAASEEKQEDFAFAANDAYALDVVMTTGEGKPREADAKPTIFRRAVERKYILKSQLGRAFMSQVENNFPTLPFSLRQVSDDRACKVGVGEAMRHELLVPYAVSQDKAGELTARFKVTVHLTASGIKKVTGLPFVQERLLKTREVESEELKALLSTSLNPKKNKKKQKAETNKSE